MRYHEQDLRIVKELGDRAGEGHAYGNLGNVYRSLGDFKQAIGYHTQHLSIAKELSDKAGKGEAYKNLGDAYGRLGDFKRAVEYHSQHLSVVLELGNRAGEGCAYGDLGRNYVNLGDFKKAIEYHKQDLNIAIELGRRDGEGHAYGNLGTAYYSLGDFQNAIECHNQHLHIAIELGCKAREGSAYGNLGNAYQGVSDYKQALDYHTQNLAIAKELVDKDEEGTAYGSVGTVYGCLGNFKKAIEYHNKHLSIAKKLGNRHGEGIACGNLGLAYWRLGDFEKAIEYHIQDLDIAKDLGDRAGEGAAYGNLGLVYHYLGDFKQAFDYYIQQLSIAKELGDKQLETCAYGNLGNVCRHLGNLKQATEYRKQEISIAKKPGNITSEALAYFSLGNDFESLDSLHEALDNYHISVKLYNKVRALLMSEDDWKISFRNACRYAYTSLWRTLVKLQKIDETLCVAEQGRAQALNDLMKLQYDSELQASGSFDSELTISGILSDASTQTVFVALDVDTINIWVLKGTSVQLNKTTSDVASLVEGAFKEIGANVGVECENRTLDESEVQVPINNEESCQKIHNDKNKSLHLLYDAIISPIVNELEGDELVIVPDGPLCLVPYAACVDKASRFLSESTRIRIIPSLTSLKLIRDCPDVYHKTTGALLVGNPSVEEVKKIRGKRVRLSCLLRAEEEVRIIGKILDTKPLTGKDATKNEVLKQMGSVALVHIAAHGDMKAGEIALAPNPDRPSKILKDKDFLLTVADVRKVQLRERLVVLSCCHSAQGKVTDEGVVGIGRAFLGAGARSVLVSLWAINDKATMEFMKSFYKHLGGGCSASVALNRAMKCLRESEEFGAVKYWAPFVLIGDDVTIEFGENQ